MTKERRDSLFRVLLGGLGASVAVVTALQDTEHLTWQTALVTAGTALLTWTLRYLTDIDRTALPKEWQDVLNGVLQRPANDTASVQVDEHE